ncbi:MAG: flagellar basal body L-ring protein FlgH [Alphaproteobacteria bacterium]|nr:flagellar basal body L-ring protein FlgH [Alphaproteobacteria bacterium]
MRTPAASLSTVCALAAALALAGCGNTIDRLANVGQAPPLTPIANPTASPDYKPITLPMPAPEPPARHANSLWRPGARSFFKDSRASRVGDIVTVAISITDKAELENNTTRSRTNSDKGNLTNFFGLEAELAKKLPNAIDAASILSLGSSLSNDGKGKIKRAETINLQLAAIVTQVLPNGNLVIQGRQEVVVNFEARDLVLSGVVRPEDIDSTNQVKHTQIAEARIAYGGRGQVTDMQQPRYGQQILDILMPF